MKRPTMLFLNGESASGKNYYTDNFVPNGLFHNLLVTTTRPLRPGEIQGVHRNVVDENFFFENRAKFATWSWVNDYNPNDTKWMYGVLGCELLNNRDKNLTYDIIEPRYTRMMIDWCRAHKLNYDFKIAWFIPPKNNLDIALARANMQNEQIVRTRNTCTIDDFLNANLRPDFIIQSTIKKTNHDPRFQTMINRMQKRK